MTRILVCVLSCQKNSALWPTILDRIKNNNILIFCGGSETTEFNESSKILYLNCNDFYEGLPEKMICMIEQVLTLECFKDVTHILKIDDHDIDLISDPESLVKLSNRDELWKHDYIGQTLREVPGSGYGGCHFGKVSKGCYWDSKFYTGPFTSWLDGGHTYILSRTALQIINSNYDSNNINLLRANEIYEDVMIALILAEYSIKPYTLNYLK